LKGIVYHGSCIRQEWITATVAIRIKGAVVQGNSYVKSHPGEELSIQHVHEAGVTGGGESGQVYHHDDAAGGAVGGTLLPAEVLHGVAADHATVRVDDEDNLLTGVGKGLEGGPQDCGVLVKTDGSGLGANRRQRHGFGSVALEGKTGADEVERLRPVPGTGGEDHGGQSVSARQGRRGYGDGQGQ
jgi:hypothetical protein